MLFFIFREMIRLISTTHFSNRHIAKATNFSPNTVLRYRKRLLKLNMSWEKLDVLDDQELQKLLSKKHMPISGKRQPDWLYIIRLMQTKHQTLAQLWVEYRRIEPEDAYSYSQFTHLYRQYLKHLDISMRQIHYAGECTYVDYAGKTIPWIDSATGKEYSAQIFVGVLGCSQYIFAWASRSQKIEDWIEAHIQMLAFFEGSTSVIVPDNLKSAVIRAGKFPIINRAYLELSHHYGCVIEPARVRKPQDKSLAEIGVLLVTRWITVVLKRRKFFSVSEINEAIPELLKILNDRKFKRLPGCRSSRFIELDKPLMKPLPEHRFEYGKWIAAQKVPSDYHVYILGHAYSVPYQYVSEKVEARVSHNKVSLFHKNKQITSHVRSHELGAVTTNKSHRPISHQAYAEQSREHFINWSKQYGENVFAIFNEQFKGKPEYSIAGCRACGQLKKLFQQYGQERFKSACNCACEIQSLTVTSIRSILQCRLDQNNLLDEPTQPELPLHYNVRGAKYYQNEGD